MRSQPDGTLTVVAGNGIKGYSGDGGAAVSASLNGPRGLALDAAGVLYIADTHNYRIRRVSGGIITTVAGGGDPIGSGDGGPATSASLANPNGVAVDGAGNLYIADTSHFRVRKVSGGIITPAVAPELSASREAALCHRHGLRSNSGSMLGCTSTQARRPRYAPICASSRHRTMTRRQRN